MRRRRKTKHPSLPLSLKQGAVQGSTVNRKEENGKLRAFNSPLFFFDAAPRLQRGVNGSEFKTLCKVHLLCVADAKPNTPRYRYRSNKGQYKAVQ
jgi:hypothetical protein